MVGYLILRSGVFAASRRMGLASWFETAQGRLLTMRVSVVPHNCDSGGRSANPEPGFRSSGPSDHPGNDDKMLSPEAKNPAKLQKSGRATASLDFRGFAAMVRATFGKSERLYEQ